MHLEYTDFNIWVYFVFFGFLGNFRLKNNEVPYRPNETGSTSLFIEKSALVLKDVDIYI